MKKRNDINITFVQNIIEPILRNLAKGRKGDRGKDEFTKVYPSMIENVDIKIPKLTTNQFDIEAQNKIVRKIQYIDDLKSNVKSLKNQLNLTLIDLREKSEEIFFKDILIQEILDSPPTNSGLKKLHVSLNKNSSANIPVYSASKNKDKIFGWVNEESKWKKYENVLTWNKDGSANYVFYRKERFVPYEKVKILKIKSKYSNSLLYEYLKIVIQDRMILEGFDFNFKCSMARVLKLYIPIPYSKKGEINTKAQRRFAEKYYTIERIKSQIIKELDRILNSKIDYLA